MSYRQALLDKASAVSMHRPWPVGEGGWIKFARELGAKPLVTALRIEHVDLEGDEKRCCPNAHCTPRFPIYSGVKRKNEVIASFKAKVQGVLRDAIWPLIAWGPQGATGTALYSDLHLNILQISVYTFINKTVQFIFNVVATILLHKCNNQL
eukprot:1159721-Pelagomonas_calceolata.AAC.2